MVPYKVDLMAVLKAVLLAASLVASKVVLMVASKARLLVDLMV